MTVPPVLSVRRESWPLSRPFTISRGTKHAADVVVAEVARGPVVGRGECVPYPRYGETVDAVVDALCGVQSAVAKGLTREHLLSLMPPGAARNALDCALWDLEAKESDTPVHRLLGLPPPQPTATAETIVLGSSADMAEAARSLRDRPLLKLKLDGEAVVERVAAVRRAAPQARLVVDANEAWTLDRLKEVAADLAVLGVEMIEQPLSAGADGGLDSFTSPVALCADESCHTGDDLPALVHRYAMVNVKLDKAGGLTAAARLAVAAQEKGFGVMVGCMVGTSLAMAPAMMLACLADYVDLDGPLWLARDRVPPLRIENGIIHLPDRRLWG